MSKQNHIVVIGGTACGPKAAARARRCDPAASITLIEQGENLSSATCGLPYYVSGVIASEKEMVTRRPDFFRETMGMEVFIHTRATAIRPQKREVDLLDTATDNSSVIGYDKLVLATGSIPAVPDFPGKDLKGIFTLTKLENANGIKDFLPQLKTKSAVIVGAGLIGMEMAEALTERGLKVTVIEALDRLLPSLLDSEIAALVERHARSRGVKFLFGQRVSGFEGNGTVRKAITADGELEAGLVLLSLGVRPNVQLAREAGLEIGATGGIAVNERLQTSDPDIYAGGDCVENVNRITGKKVLAPMGSTANKHGRIIGTNVTGGHETFPGVLGTGVVKIFDYSVARTGQNEGQAQEAGLVTETALVPAEEYASYYPGGRDIIVKLVAEKPGGRLLGVQAIGPGETAKRIDIMATAISLGAGVADLANLDLAYAPPYNSAMDPLHNAANVIRNKLEGLARTQTPAEIKSRLDNGDDFVLLDVRSPGEWQTGRIEAPQARLIPLGELRKKLGELSKDDDIVIYCRTSVRAYQAQRILDGAGFKNVKFMDGSLMAWPYEMQGRV